MENPQAIRDNYYFIEYPYISKSSYKTFKTCKYKFKGQILDGVSNTPNRVMVRGTSLHYMFFKFFELIDFEYLFELDWSTNNGTVYSAVYQYFYSLFLTYLGKEDAGKIENSFFRMNLEAFCMFEENQWASLKITYRNKIDVRRYFNSGINEREKFLYNDELMIFGTIDRIMHEEGKTIIVDYKTGKVPKKLLVEFRTGAYTSALPNHFVGEGNFYVLLYLLNNGYTTGTDDKGKICIMRDGKECNKALKKIDYAFIYTGRFIRGRPQYFVARKKSNIVSIRTIIKNLGKIRAWNDWVREPALVRCKWCHLYIDECRGKIPIEIYGDLLRGETAPPKDVHKSE